MIFEKIPVECYELINYLCLDNNEEGHQFNSTIQSLFLLDLPIQLIDYLYLKNAHYHYSIARHKNTPQNILLELSKNEDADVRSSVAHNINTPIEVLIQLSKDKDLSVRVSTARNINTPIKILKSLYNEDNVFVRLAIASNTNTPNQILKELLNDNKFKSTAFNTLIKKKNLKLFQ